MRSIYLLALGVALSISPKALATDPEPDSFTAIDFPGATLTEAWGIKPAR